MTVFLRNLRFPKLKRKSDSPTSSTDPSTWSGWTLKATPRSILKTWRQELMSNSPVGLVMFGAWSTAKLRKFWTASMQLPCPMRILSNPLIRTGQPGAQARSKCLKKSWLQWPRPRRQTVVTTNFPPKTKRWFSATAWDFNLASTKALLLSSNSSGPVTYREKLAARTENGTNRWSRKERISNGPKASVWLQKKPNSCDTNQGCSTRKQLRTKVTLSSVNCPSNVWSSSTRKKKWRKSRPQTRKSLNEELLLIRTRKGKPYKSSAN